MSIYSAVSANIWKSYLILFLFVIFTGTVGYVIGKAMGDSVGIGIPIFIFSLIYSFVSYFFADKMVLATSGAKRIEEKDNPELFHLVENLAMAEGLAMPKVHVIHDASPNAFATGRDPKHASIAVTTGLMNKLSKAELEGVLAHELSHVKNFDTRLLAITSVMVGFIAMITDIFMRSVFFGTINNDNRDSRLQVVFLVLGIILAIIAPIIAIAIQLAVSRKREFLADASGALITRYPEGLARALEKISADPKPLRSATSSTAHLFISNPFKGKGFSGWLTNAFSTHPPIEERIKILRSM